MKTIRLCPNCAAPLAPGAPDGLCQRCQATDGPTEMGLPSINTRAEPEPGQLFGGYRVMRLLGQGGMGAVYEAEDIENGRRVALKVLRHAPDSPTARQRFLREGRLAAAVNHPNSVYIYGAEEIEGAPVITMEYVPGGTLTEIVKTRGPLPVSEAVDAILQIIAGLESAAAKGVLHRDVKPSNCFVGADGAVKVGDFGLSISTMARDQTNLTLSGAIMGTPNYASPEQLRGDELDVRSDIYSVGVTLYFLLTGQTPFNADNMMKLLATVLEKPAPPPRALRPEIPKQLEQIVLRCLAKAPAQRFKDYEELRMALLPFGSSEPAPAHPGMRFVAGAIDSFLVGILSMVVAMVVVKLSGQGDRSFHDLQGAKGHWEVWAAIAQALYLGILEGFWGAGPGKALCRIRVIGPNRNVPGFPRAFGRALLYVFIPYLGYIPAWFLTGGNLDEMSRSVRVFSTVAYYLFFVLLFVTARRRNGFAGIHELLSGSRVVLSSSLARRSQQKPETETSAPAPATSDLPSLGPFHVLETIGSHSGGEILLGYDSRLLRKVWIRKQPLQAAATPAARRELSRKGRLHWLASRRSGEECWDAYEAIPGQALAGLLNTPQSWESVRFWLHDLAEELEAASRDGTSPGALAVDRVWITADGRAKLLDFPAPLKNGPTAESRPVASELSPPRFLFHVARSALAGRGFVDDSAAGLPETPLPMFARKFLQTLPEANDLPAVVAELHSFIEKPAAVSSNQRRAVMYLSIFIAIMCTGFLTMGTGFAKAHAQRHEQQPLLPDLNRLSDCLTFLEERAADSSDPKALDERKAMQIFVAGDFSSSITNSAFWTNVAVLNAITPAKRQLAEEAVAAHPAPSPTELREARALLKPHFDSTAGHASSPPEKAKEKDETFAKVLALLYLLSFTVPSLAGALVFRRGLGLRLLRIEIVTKSGEIAPRWRVFLRWLFAWLPTLVTIGLLILFKHPWPLFLFLAVVVGAIIYRFVRPGRPIRERISGTWLVPE